MSEEKKGVFTLVVPLDRDKTKVATYQLREMDEQTFNAARALIDNKKDFDAVRLIVKSLYVSGDSIDYLKEFVAVNSAAKSVLELIKPIEGELKKN